MPRSFCMHDLGGSRHDASHMMHCVIVRATMTYAKQVAQALSFVLGMQRSGKVVRRKRKLDDMSDSLLSCKFIEVSKATHAELTMLYDREVIDWSTYRRLVTAAVGISADIADMSTRDPWSHDDRRELLGGTNVSQSVQNQVTHRPHQ